MHDPVRTPGPAFSWVPGDLPALASTGRLQTGSVWNLQGAAVYRARASGCAWVRNSGVDGWMLGFLTACV